MSDVIILKAKWNREKEHYKTKEVGDGVQSFVIDVLQSKVFNLKKGLGSQTNSKRENEFTLEHSKQGEDMHTRRADIVIFVNASIVIPTEVEKFENILAGESQIMAYQKDWDKKYGILTDGYTWRFYNNTKYQIFTLDDLLNKTDDFKSFWSDYTKENNYYLEFFNPNQDGLFTEENKPLKVQENHDLFFSETTTLIERFITKTGLYEKIKDKKLQTELAYSYLIQFVLVKVLVDSGFEIFVNDYNEKLSNIIANLKKSNYSKILATIRNLSSAIEKDLYKPFKEDQKFINEKLDDLLKKNDEQIGDISIWLDIICYIHRFDFSGIKNDIFGGIYENYLKALYSEENLGQFFTPPEVVDFMLEEIGWTEEEIKKRAGENKDNLSIIDPSCGSGTFLYSATNILMNAIPHEAQEQSKKVEKLVNDNIFGLDVEEFSLYLAEMSMLMRLLPCIINEKYNNPVEKKLKIFKTNDSIAEFWLQYKTNKAIDAEQTDSLFSDDYTDLGYKSLIRDDDDMVSAKQTLIGEKRERFDFVIGNPPYIGYNESSKRQLLCFEMIKGKIKDKNGNIVKIDLNDIYGINLHSIPSNRKKYSPKPNLYAMFIALANGLLKQGGKMCYIIPQTLLTNTDYDVIRYYLSKEMTIEKIITFSCKMFVDRGIKKKRDIATSSLILVVKKSLPDAKHKVEVLHYEKSDAGVDEALTEIRKAQTFPLLEFDESFITSPVKGDEFVRRKQILQSELLENVDNWNYIKQGKEFLKFYNFYKNNTEDLSCYYEHKKARERFGEEFWFDKGLVFKAENIKDTPETDLFFNIIKCDKNLFTPKLLDKFIDKKNLTLPYGSQGFNLFFNKYKIIWSFAATNFVFTDEKIMMMASYCFITSNNKANTLFIFSLLTSFVSKAIFNKICTVENEDKLSRIISIKTIKSFIRIPVITAKNEHIKAKIIEQTEKMLAIENVKLKDLVSFRSKLAVLPQKFDKVKIQTSPLAGEVGPKGRVMDILLCDNVEFEITKNEAFVEKLVKEIELPISLQSLKDLEAIDFEMRDAMKKYIDHLVFALYCNVELDKIEFLDFEHIKQECQKSEFYEIIFN
jgi:type I restriction-modification system DNA methylase subunit